MSKPHIGLLKDAASKPQAYPLDYRNDPGRYRQQRRAARKWNALSSAQRSRMDQTTQPGQAS